MDQQLKQRLVGAIIIVSLVVIFVPMLFEEEQEGQSAVGAGDIPALPRELNAKAIELPKSAADTAPSEGGESAYTGYRIIPLTDGDSVAAENGGMPPANLDEQQENRPDSEADLDPEAPPQAVGGSNRAPVVNAPEQVKGGIDSVSSQAQVPLSKTKPKPVSAKSPEKEPKKPKSAKAPNAEKVAPSPATSRKPATVKSPSDNQKAISSESVSKAAESPSRSIPTGGGAALAEPKVSAEASDDLAAWVVQTGSFNTESNARALAEKLRKSNFPAFVEVVTNAGNSIYRVQVGPELNRTRAEQVQKQIEDIVGVKGIVVPHP
jgi:DedD protein